MIYETFNLTIYDVIKNTKKRSNNKKMQIARKKMNPYLKNTIMYMIKRPGL